MRHSRRVRFVCLALLAGLLALLPASPASAHATLAQSTPAADSIVAQAPNEVTLTYDQAVSTSFGAIKVLAPDGTQVDTGQVSSRNGGRTVADTLHANLAPGTYTILWRVVSADTHTVFGAVTFSVKTQSSSSAAAVAEDKQASIGAQADRALAVTRGVLYTGLALLVGGVAFLLALWPTGASVRAARRVPWAGWVLAVVGSVAGLFIDGPYAAGQPLSSVFDLTLLGNVLGGRYGVATIIRLVLLAMSAVLLVGLGRLRRKSLAIGGIVLGVGVLASTSAIGHAGTGDLDVVAWPADVLHMAAASGWLGGLAMLVAVMLHRRPVELSTVLPNWSRYAATCVAVLILTGIFAGWRQVRELGALTGTSYGHLLLIKTAVVLVMVALGALGRNWVRRHYLLAGRALVTAQPNNVPAELAHASASSSNSASRQRAAFGTGFDIGQAGGSDRFDRTDLAFVDRDLASTAGEVKRLRLSVLLEAVLGLAVLSITAVLVATTPADKAYTPVFNQTATVMPDLRLHVEIEPARTGLNDMLFSYTNKAGKVVDVQQVTARWTEVHGSYIVPVQLTRTSLGQYDRRAVELPASGTWQLAVISQTSDIEALSTLFTVNIR